MQQTKSSLENIKKLIQNKKKIALLGCPGSGKTTYAIRLKKILNLPVYHLDRYAWTCGWHEQKRSRVKKIHDSLCRKSSWIIDGNFFPSIRQRIKIADLIIIFNISFYTCLWRIIKRWFFYRNKQRQDLALGCHDQLNYNFLCYAANFKKTYFQKILNIVSEKQAFKKTIFISNNRDAQILFNIFLSALD
jgi:adenylate kinase family enzyme